MPAAVLWVLVGASPVDSEGSRASTYPDARRQRTTPLSKAETRRFPSVENAADQVSPVGSSNAHRSWPVTAFQKRMAPSAAPAATLPSGDP